ncbi:MAG: DUF1491 family protein [Sphingomonadales bacterium]|nr:DUF1491 family protein [Sphingomonadales bacterium]
MSLEPRLASSVEISSFLRRAQAQGDFATILKKGDPVSGAILVVAVIRGANPVLYERYPTLDGPPQWDALSSHSGYSDQQMHEYLDKRSQSDPDLWVIELDTADNERLAGLLL